MTNDELKGVAASLGVGSVEFVESYLNAGYDTGKRWLSGKIDVPGPVAQCARLWQSNQLLIRALDYMESHDFIEGSGQQVVELFADAIFAVAVEMANSQREIHNSHPRECYWDGESVQGSGDSSYTDAERQELENDARALIKSAGLRIC